MGAREVLPPSEVREGIGLSWGAGSIPCQKLVEGAKEYPARELTTMSGIATSTVA
jgi:hypothetical protein